MRPRAQKVVVFSGSTVTEYLDWRAFSAAPPADVVVLDLTLGDGTTVTENVRRLGADGSSVIIHSVADRPAAVREALAAGAAGVVSKASPIGDVIAAISTVAHGEPLNNVEWASAVEGDRAFADAQLSARERDVLRLYAAGLPLKVVADRLGVAYSTAKENITRVRVKYVEVGRPAPTKVDLLRRAMEDGILAEPATEKVPVVSEPESTRAILDDAWGHIPQTRETTAGLGSFTRLRIERIISLVVGLGSLVLGTQAFLAALGAGPGEPGMARPAHADDVRAARGDAPRVPASAAACACSRASSRSCTRRAHPLADRHRRAPTPDSDRPAVDLVPRQRRDARRRARLPAAACRSSGPRSSRSCSASCGSSRAASRATSGSRSPSTSRSR